MASQHPDSSVAMPEVPTPTVFRKMEVQFTEAYVANPAPYEFPENRQQSRENPRHYDILRFHTASITENEYPQAFQEYSRILPVLKNAVRNVRTGTIPAHIGLDASGSATQPFGSMIILALFTPTPPPESRCVGSYMPVPTVVIYTTEPSGVSAELAGLSTELRVEVVRGHVHFGARNGLGLAAANTSYQPCPAMGQSLGAAGARGSGTLGGWVGGKKSGRVFALTNAHVVFMGDAKVEVGSIYGPGRDGSGQERRMVQPSDSDAWETLLKKYEYLRKTVDQDEMHGGQRPQSVRERRKAEQEFEEAKATVRHLGTAYYAHYGLQKSATTNCSSWLDIAIIAVTPDRAGRNVYNKTEWVAGTAAIRPGTAVFKANGRTTGCTRGVVNGTVAEVFMRNPAKPEDPAIETREYVVLSRPDDVSRTPISAGGDSGSIFVDSNDKAVGLMFGGATRADSAWEYPSCEVTLLTPMTSVLEHISTVLGEEVEVIEATSDRYDAFATQRPGSFPVEDIEATTVDGIRRAWEERKRELRR